MSDPAKIPAPVFSAAISFHTLFGFILLFMLIAIGCKPLSKPRQVSFTDRFNVAETAIHYMMDKHSGHGAESNYFSAYVLDGEEYTANLVASFANHEPPVIANVQTSEKNGGIIDKATGKPIMLWSVKVENIQSNSAIAYVSWHSGNLAAGGHTIHLRRKNGKWVVESETMDWIS